MSITYTKFKCVDGHTTLVKCGETDKYAPSLRYCNVCGHTDTQKVDEIVIDADIVGDFDSVDLVPK